MSDPTNFNMIEIEERARALRAQAARDMVAAIVNYVRNLRVAKVTKTTAANA